MKGNNTKLASIIVLLLILFNIRCSEPEPEPETPPTILTAEKNQYSSFEFFQFGISSIANGSIVATIGEIEVVLEVLDNKATTILPNLSNGNHQIIFQHGTTNYLIDIKIVNRQNLEEADVYFNQSIRSIENKIDKINSNILELNDLGESDVTPILSSDLQKYLEMLNNYKTQFSNLTEFEKQEFALFMITHSQLYTESTSTNSYLKNTTSSDIYKEQATNDYEKEIEVSMISFSGQVIFTVAHIPAILTLSKVMASPNPYISGGAAVAASMLVVHFMISAMETATAGVVLTKRAIKPIEILVNSGTIEFESAKERFVDIKAKYRSMISIDTGDDGSVIKNIANSYYTFKNSFNSLRLKLPESFRPSYVIAELQDIYNSSSRYVYNEYIRILNVDNPNIQLEKINLDNGGYHFKASTSQTNTQEFKFDVEYSNGKFAGTLKERLSGKIEIIDSIPIYNSAAVGKWAVQNLAYDDVYILELYSNGTGKYTGYLGGDSFPNGGYGMSWSITKKDGRYFLRESGFWHPGYNQFRVTNGTLPRAALRYPLDFFFHYNDYGDGEGAIQAILYTKL